MKKINLLSWIFYFLIIVFSTVAIAEETEEIESNLPYYTTDLDKIVVTSSKIAQKYKFSTQNISIITKEDIESSGITEITEILQLLPSVDILEYGSRGSTRSVHTRGASANQVITLIDGRPVNTPRDGETDFNQIPLSNIERIEVLRGPASSMYGANAVGGVINIITKSGKEKMHTELSTEFGSFSTKLTSLAHGYKINKFDYFLTYDYSASHGHRSNSDYLSNNINTKLGYQINEDNHLSLSSGYYNSEVETPGSITYFDPNDWQEVFKKYIDLTYTGKFLEGQDVLLKIFHNSDRLEYTTENDPAEWDPIGKDTHLTKIYGFDGQISQIFFDIFRTAIGFDYRENRLNSSKNAKHTYNQKGAYFESETNLFENGSLKFGARWDDYSNFGDRISPSTSFNLWLFDIVKLHALAAKSFRAPNFNDLYWNDPYMQGNPNLSPEKAESIEAGLSSYLFDKIKTDITFFRTNYENLLQWGPTGGIAWSPENVNSAVTKGVELETEFVLKKHLKFNINYTFLDARNKTTKKWLIYRPQHQYKLRLIYSPNSNLELGISAFYKTKRFADTDNTDPVKHTAVLNFNSSYKINDNLKILFEVKNIFDRQYEEERGYPLPGRSFFGGIKLTF